MRLRRAGQFVVLSRERFRFLFFVVNGYKKTFTLPLVKQGRMKAKESSMRKLVDGEFHKTFTQKTIFLLAYLEYIEIQYLLNCWRLSRRRISAVADVARLRRTPGNAPLRFPESWPCMKYGGGYEKIS